MQLAPVVGPTNQAFKRFASGQITIFEGTALHQIPILSVLETHIEHLLDQKETLFLAFETTFPEVSGGCPKI